MSVDSIPFYRDRMESPSCLPPWGLYDWLEYAQAHQDPFGGRKLPGALPLVVVQLEGPSDPPLYLALGRQELRGWARAVTYLWRLWGVGPGQIIALYDYGSSPMVFLAHRRYTPHLQRGAADALGAKPICNDGLASMAPRMVEIFRYLRPQGLIVRAELVSPLAHACREMGVTPEEFLSFVVLTEAEGVPKAAVPWRVTTLKTWRADAAFFVAGECPLCRLFHVPPLYRLARHEDGTLLVSAPFGEIFPVVGYRLGPAHLEKPGCPRESSAWRLRPC